MTTELAVSEAREHFAEAVETAATEPVFITKHGRRVAALISPERYEQLMVALEDAEDIADANDALAEIEAGNPAIPWEQVKADLGW